MTNSSKSNDNNDSNNKPVLIVADPTKGIIVDSAFVASPFREEIKQKVALLKQQGIDAPLLVGLLANTDPAARQYAEWTGNACIADGLRYELRTLQDAIDVEDALNDANNDPRVHGIIVYYPIFGQTESFSGASQDDYLRDSVHYKCDVEGLCHLYRSNLYRNVRYLDYPNNNEHKCLLPCTALSVVKILESCPGCYDRSKPIGKHMEQKIVTVINRSEIVGRPLAAMLSNDGAIVYSVDINSIYRFQGGRLYTCDKEGDGTAETPESCVRKSSVIITGVPTKSYRLPTEWIAPNTTIVNVSSFKNVDEEALLKIPGVVYVPRVGKVTVAMLERNLMRLFDQFHLHNTSSSSTALTATRNAEQQEKQNGPWYGHPLNLYTALTVTLLLAMQFMQQQRK